MTDYPGITLFIRGTDYWAKYVGEQVITTNDTVTLSDMVNWQTMPYVKICQQIDGSEVSCTVLNNVITITQAGLIKTKILIFAYARRNVPGA